MNGHLVVVGVGTDFCPVDGVVAIAEFRGGTVVAPAFGFSVSAVAGRALVSTVSRRGHMHVSEDALVVNVDLVLLVALHSHSLYFGYGGQMTW